MNYSSRGLLAATRKRKDREEAPFYGGKGSFGNPYKHQQLPPLMASPNTTSSGSNNKILAGYMAHEFLTKGTLFGQKFDPARAEAMPLASDHPKRRPGSEPGPEAKAPKQAGPSKSYADVAQLLKGPDGAHVPGVVNPTQLARWIQM